MESLGSKLVHTNISSTSADGVTVLRMIMIIGKPVCIDWCCDGWRGMGAWIWVGYL